LAPDACESGVGGGRAGATCIAGIIRTSLLVTVSACFALLTTLWNAADAGAEDIDTYLLPGVDIRSADFRAGAWCRYYVIDEADGFSDTSEVYVAVTGSEKIGSKTSWWLRFETKPMRGDTESTDRTRILIDDDIRTLARGDSLYHYVRKFFVQRGTGAVESGDHRDLERLTLSSPASDRRWTHHPEESIATPAGAVDGTRNELDVSQTRRRPSGRVTVIQKRHDHYTVWSSPAVPIFHLARGVIDRSRESITSPHIPGIPNSGVRVSKVITELIAYGVSGSR